ncbi:unnamed protein product [Allacma fusca]|uniref:Uncharacterized protein n=1 Tax=Allacma fusca TaxID=39272 RepID=A0A8J2LUT4_9HEXA|nr:unnamed protein product [Allacma fusca]
MSQSSKYRLHRKTLKRLRLADDPDLCYVCVPLTPSVASKSGDVVLQQTSLLQGRVTSPSSQEYGVAEVVDVFLEDVPQTDHQQTGPPQAEISEVAQSIVSQITKRYFRELTVNKYNPTAPPHRSNTMNATGEYKLLHEISANVMEPFIRNTRRNHVSCQLRCYRTFVSTKGTVYHSQLYYRVQRRESFHVCTNMNDIFTIKLFVRDNTCNTVTAVGTVHKIRPCFNLEHIFEGVSSIAGEIHTGEINDLVLKVVYNNCLYFCKFLNNFSHICE